MSKKNVIHITQAFGGVKTYIKYILEFCSQELFEFSIIAPYNKELSEFCEINKIKYFKININRGLKPFSDIYSLYKICEILRNNKFDIIHCHSAKGGFLGRLAGKLASKKSKIIFTPNGFSYLSFSGLRRIIFFSLECISKNWSTFLLTVSISESNRARFEIGYKSTKILTIPNSISISKRKVTRDYTRCLTIGMISRLTSQKNPILFLEIAKEVRKKYPNIHFKILGAGYHDHMAKEVSKFINDNNLQNNVTIIDWGTDISGISFLDEIDIFMLTSTFEGLPFSLLEAMDSGLPCLVTKVDGNSDVIQNSENGFSCLNASEFITKVETLINDKEMRSVIGNSAKQYVSQYHNINILKNTFNNLYSSI